MNQFTKANGGLDKLYLDNHFIFMFLLTLRNITVHWNALITDVYSLLLYSLPQVDKRDNFKHIYMNIYAVEIMCVFCFFFFFLCVCVCFFFFFFFFVCLFLFLFFLTVSLHISPISTADAIYRKKFLLALSLNEYCFRWL